MDNKQASRIVGGNPAQGRRESDFYPTPPEVTFALLDFLQLPKSTLLWDPAAGDDDMVKAIRARGYVSFGTDIRFGEDFLKIKAPANVGMIITNPPFSAAEDFIRHAAEIGIPFAFLLKSQFWHAARRMEIFEQTPPAYVLPLTWRPDFNFKSGKRGSPLMDVMWCVWPFPIRGGGTQYIPLRRPRESIE